MKKFLIGAAFALAPLTMIATPADAKPIALASLAVQDGYVYAYLGPEDAVSLSRPGVTILIRPGQTFFDVNDHSESVGGAPPFFYQHDVFVNDQFQSRLREIAKQFNEDFPMATGPRRFMKVVIPAVSNMKNDSNMDFEGSIENLKVKQVEGDFKIRISGSAPPNAPVAFTLVETIATELPDVIVSRGDVLSDASGKFEATVDIAPAFFRGSILNVVASSTPKVTSAKKSIVLELPNKNVITPSEKAVKGD